MGSIPGLGRSPGEGNGKPLQYSCLENSMGRGAWRATVHGVAKELDVTLRLNSWQPWKPPAPLWNPQDGTQRRLAERCRVEHVSPSGTFNTGHC